jgi:hypothetical protein
MTPQREQPVLIWIIMIVLVGAIIVLALGDLP